MNIEKLKRLQSQVRIGGKGTPRRKKKVMHQTAAADDKKLQSSLKKLSVSTIPGIEEVNIIRDDLTVIHFNNPKAQASLSANTFAVTGHGETKKIVEMLPDILPQLGQETVVQLRMFANSMTKHQKEGVHGFEPNLFGNTDEDDVPLLVSDFDEISKKEDLNKEQMQRTTKEPVLSAEINSTRESAAMQSTEKYRNPDNNATENAGSLIDPLRTPDNNVKSEMEINKDNPKKSDKCGNVKEGNVKKDHKPKNKATNSHPSSCQHEIVCSINEPLQDSGCNVKNGADVKETEKKNATKTTEIITAGTNIKAVNVKKETSKSKNKVIDAAPSPSQHTKTEPFEKCLHTLDNNVKRELDVKGGIKKSETNNNKKTSEPDKTGILKDSNVKKESIRPKNKVTQAVTSSISQQKNEKTNECNRLLPTKELKKDIIKASDKSSNINADTSPKVPTNLQNVTELKDDQTMVSNAHFNTYLIEQTKNDLTDQKNLIKSNLTDGSLLFTDSNVHNLETSNKDTHQEKNNETIISLDKNNKDFQVTVSSLSSVLPFEDLKKENTQELQHVLVSTSLLEKAIKNVAETKYAAEDPIVLLDLKNPYKNLDPDDTLNNTSKCDTQGEVGIAPILNSVTKKNDVQEEQNLLISDTKLCLDEKKAANSQFIDSAIVSAFLPDPLQTKEIKSEEMPATSLINIEKPIKVVEIMRDVDVSLKLKEENSLEREASEKVFEGFQNIKTQTGDGEISKDLLKNEEHNFLNTKTMPEDELAKQAFHGNTKSQNQIDPDLTAKSTPDGPSQKKDVLRKDTGKPQLASPIKPGPKKTDPTVRPKQVSPPKSHTQQSSSTGTTLKTQQTTKSTSGSKSVKQEKASVAPKVKQTLSTSIKSQATATASKSLTTQAKKTSVSSPLDPSIKKSVAIKASSVPETTQVPGPAQPRADNNNQKEAKKPKPQSIATSGQQKVAEDPPKACQ